MPTRIFIDGAAGTTGLEIHDRLRSRADLELIVLSSEDRKNDAARRDALNEAEIVILCLPDDAARGAVAMIDSPAVRVIDASSAHRVSPGWTYGFPELLGYDVIGDADRVSNPGCYPTGFLSLIAPLTKTGLLKRNYPYSVNAVSGYSGGGKPLIERFGTERDIAWRGYGFNLDHKHLAEMQTYAGLAAPPVFAPSVVPAFRGMIVEVPLTTSAFDTARTMQELHTALAEFYRDRPLVTVRSWDDVPGEIVLREQGKASDRVELYVMASPDGGQARLVAKLDNLGKGASGAAIQSLNIMLGADETLSLLC